MNGTDVWCTIDFIQSSPFDVERNMRPSVVFTLMLGGLLWSTYSVGSAAETTIARADLAFIALLESTITKSITRPMAAP
jgi:hypothetical protein